MAGIVPLEQRKSGGADIVVTKTKGMYYGIYDNMNNTTIGGGPHSTTHTTHKRESSSANSLKRKEKRPMQTETNGFSHSTVVTRSVVDKKHQK